MKEADAIEVEARFYIDCEFDGHGGPLLSIAIVEEDGRSVHIEADVKASDPWVLANVVPLMDKHDATDCTRVHPDAVGGMIRWFIGNADRPTIIADSPVDIGRFCQAISTGEDGGWASADYPLMTFEVHNVDCYPTDLPGAVQHNAWWDAMALRYRLSALTPRADRTEREAIEVAARLQAQADEREAGVQREAAHRRRGAGDVDIDEMREWATVPGVRLDDLQAILALRPTPPVEVGAIDRAREIKPLKWSEPHPSTKYPNWFAQVYAIRFEARIDTSRAGMFGKFPLSINGLTVDEQFDSLEGAKAYAQANYEVRVRSAFNAALSTPAASGEASFQQRVQPWLMACFGEMIAGDREERNHRFLEEALELVQACGCTAHEAHQLVDYVYGRPVGELHQEVGGVMVTLAALCLANDSDMHAAGWVELDRIWGKVEAIRAKQAAKPKHSPLPIAPGEA
jgi:hypothetical protein